VASARISLILAHLRVSTEEATGHARRRSGPIRVVDGIAADDVEASSAMILGFGEDWV